MGNYLASPISVKDSFDGHSGRIRFGVSSMQGWRVSMEDSHLARLNAFSSFPNMHIFGVFDGHGGAHVSRFVARHLRDELVKSATFHEGKFEDALRDAFFSIDKMLCKDEYQEELEMLSQDRCCGLDNYEDVDNSTATAPNGALAQVPTQSSTSNTTGHPEDYQSSNFMPRSPPTASTDCEATSNAAVFADAVIAEPSSSHGANTSGKGARIKFLSSTRQQWREERRGKKEKKTAAAASSAERNEARSKLARLRDSMDIGSRNQPTSDQPANTIVPTPCTRAPSSVTAAIPRRQSNTLVDAEPVSPAHTARSRSDETIPTAAVGGFLLSVRGVVSTTLSTLKQAVWNPLTRSPSRVPSLAMLAGCTSIVALINETQIVLANAGDSRAVLCRDGKALELSVDHKPNLPSEKNRIYCARGYVEMGRVNGNLNLSRAIGDLQYKQDISLPPEKQIVTAKPDIKIVEIEERDEFLVLGCDGIWEKADSSQFIVDFIRQRIEPTRPLTEILEELFEELLSPNPAIFEHGCDNMTAVIVDLQNGRHVGNECASQGEC